MQPDLVTRSVASSRENSRDRLLFGDRWIAWRNRLLADPRFHRWARRNIFTRYIARRRARQMFDLCAGFVYSQTLCACVELKLFPLLERGSQSRDQISHALALDVDATDTLLRSAVSLRLLQKLSDGTYGLGIHGAALLANPGVLAMIEHHAFFYRDLTDPVSLLRRENANTHLSMFWDYSGSGSASSGEGSGQQLYTQLMSASQSMVAEQIVDVYPMGAHQRLLDVGGGDGTFLRAVGKSASDLELVLFDLPAVVDHSRHGSSSARLPGSIQRVKGDMFNDVLPRGADIISLIRVVHDHDDAPVRQLLERCRDALPRGGTLILAEPMAVERVGDPTSDAYFSWYLHAMGSGRPRTREELKNLLTEAGFVRVVEVKTHLPMLVRLLVARVQ